MDQDAALEQLTKAGAEFRAVRTTYDASRENVRAAIVDALRAGITQSVITKLTGYTRENVRKIARAEGIPADR